MKRSVSLLLLAASAVSTLSLSSCTTGYGPVGDGVATGALIGAAAGGLTGRGVNAARGAAAGALAGGLIGAVVAENEGAYSRGGYGEPYRSYPVARRSGRPGTVVSPYAPYNEIDVRGVPMAPWCATRAAVACSSGPDRIGLFSTRRRTFVRRRFFVGVNAR